MTDSTQDCRVCQEAPGFCSAHQLPHRREQLLPCPFCGSTAKVRSEGTPDYTDTWVECTDCYARTDAVEGLHRMEAAAIGMWNSRAALLNRDGEREPVARLKNDSSTSVGSGPAPDMAEDGEREIHQPTFLAVVKFYRGFEERLDALAGALWRATAEPKCRRCGHPQSWHRHDDATESEEFRCIGYDCMAPGGPKPPCGCPDYEPEESGTPPPTPPEGSEALREVERDATRLRGIVRDVAQNHPVGCDCDACEYWIEWINTNNGR